MLQLVALEVGSLLEEEDSEMIISGAVETLVEVGAMGEMNLEDVIFQGVVGVKVDEVVKAINKLEGEEEGEVALVRVLLQHSLWLDKFWWQIFDLVSLLPVCKQRNSLVL